MFRLSGLFPGLLLVWLACAPCAVHAGPIVFLQGNDNTLDSSGNGNDGAWVGTAAYTPGVVGDAFELNGLSYVNVSAAAGLSIPGNEIITLSAYVDPAAISETGRIIDRIPVGTGNGYLLDFQGGHLRAIVGSTVLVGNNVIPVGVFTLVTAVFNGTLATSTLSLYENGVLDVTASSGAWVDNSALPLRIGADQNGGNRFSGAIDQVSITATPEPATLSLMGIGLAALLISVYRRRAA